MPVFTTAGSKLFIGGAKSPGGADLAVGDFTSQVWVEVGSVESLGSMGDTSTEVTFNDVGKGRMQKLKGTRNAGNMEVVCGIDYADAGQIALLAAERTPHDYAFKVEFNDKPAAGASPKSSQRLFVAKVMSVSEALDGADNVMKLNSTLAINSNVVRVAASAT